MMKRKGNFFNFIAIRALSVNQSSPWDGMRSSQALEVKSTHPNYFSLNPNLYHSMRYKSILSRILKSRNFSILKCLIYFIFDFFFRKTPLTVSFHSTYTNFVQRCCYRHIQIKPPKTNWSIGNIHFCWSYFNALKDSEKYLKSSENYKRKIVL